MLYETKVNLGNVLLSFSDAVDLANPSISFHQIRTAFVAWQIALEARLPERQTKRVFIGSILHDVGALTPEDKTRLHRFEQDNLETHCVRGSALYESCPLLSDAAHAVRWHHRTTAEWDEGVGDDRVLESQLVYLADVLERLTDRNVYILHQSEKLLKDIMSRAGEEIHPDVVDLFVAVGKREDFWLDLVSPRLYSTLLNFGPLKQEEIELDQLFSIAAFFKKLIDYKSPFTTMHSTGVATCATSVARMFGLTDKEISLLELAGYLHDLGKLVVPNAILEKQGGLTREEFAIMRQHTYFTYRILSTIGGLGAIPEWAAFHHERLDGAGYPFHVGSDKLDTGSRIMAVADVFTALAENRPYRRGMARSQIEKILRSMASRDALDSNLVGLLLDNYEELSRRVQAEQRTADAEYQGLMAAG